MSLIPALVQELLKIFVDGALKGPGGIGLKGYFIQQDFLSQGAPEAWLKLIKMRHTSSFSEPDVKQRG